MVNRNHKDFYDHGLPFSIILKESLDSLRQYVNDNKAGMIIIDGGLGQGKTTFGVQIAKYYEPDFDKDRQLGIGGEQFIKSAEWAVEHKKQIVIYDEAGDLSRRQSMTKFNQLLLRFFETYRIYKIIPILCLPKFWVLDQHIFDLEVPQILLHCYNRQKNYGNFMAYDLQGMFYIRHYCMKTVFKPKSYFFNRPVFVGKFLDLPEEERNILAKQSRDGKLKILEETTINLDKLSFGFEEEKQTDQTMD